MKNLKGFTVPTLRMVGDDEITLEKVQGFIKSNPDSLKDLVTDDLIVSKLGENAQLADSIFDKRVTNAIKTYEENFTANKLPSLIEEKYKLEHPDESEDSKTIRELQSRLEKAERERNRGVLSKLALSELAQSEISGANLLEPFVIGEDEESIKKNVESLLTIVKTVAKAESKKALGGIGRDEMDDSDDTPPPNQTEIERLTKELNEAMSKMDSRRAVALQNQIHKLQMG